MTGGRARARAALTALIVLAIPGAGRTHAQGWFVDAGAGRFVSDAVAATVGSNNLTGVLRYEAERDAWVFGAAGAPLHGEDTFWMAAGTGGRFLLPSPKRHAAIGADVALHGYSYRDPLVGGFGAGGTVEAIPFLEVPTGDGSVELRGGWRGQTLSFAGVRERRGVIETGARAGYGGTVRVTGEARWVFADERRYPFAGASLRYNGTRLQLWGQGGRWLASDLDEASFGGGAGVSLGARVTLWTDIRQEAPDPLYWNPTRRTWSIGITHRLGRLPVRIAPAPRTSSGRVLVRLPADAAPDGELSIAGDFNGWNPQPMRREGREWVIDLPLAPGVYHYAFRSASGRWFVPASIAGRRDDGMGGHVAVLTVSGQAESPRPGDSLIGRDRPAGEPRGPVEPGW